MALKIKLARFGSAHNPVYRMVVGEANARRDGRFVEILGTYSPKAKTEQLKLNLERADYWIANGAQPTDTSRSLIKQYRKQQAAQPAEAAEASAE
ncbi:MAG TPA: 30S ribosomal protein S16 [Opitutales bacterium]|nr:30S ribosomal protein S16 [Opitutales bacterium]